MIHALLNGNLIANNSYNEINQLTNRSFGNTIQLTQEFNANGALMSIHAKKNKQERMHLSYTYDSLNRKTAETDMLNNQNSESYQYDSANRLVNWSRANTKQQSWQLDALANWLSTTANGVTETRQHNNTNAIVSSQKNNQNVTITYDLDGNTSFDGKFYYSSDALNRIISVRDLSQNLVANYQLDAINRRISKTVDNTITTTVYAGWQVAEEQEVLVQKKNTKLTLRVYVYGNYIDEALVMKHTKPNGVVKQFWYLHNQQFSVYALLNDSGAIVEKYHYSAYGEPQIESANGGIISTTAYDNHYLYTGRLLDKESELFYFRNRYYHSSQGRFISRDPIGYVDGMSLYRGYFAVNGVDWSGLIEHNGPNANGGGINGRLDMRTPKSGRTDFKSILYDEVISYKERRVGVVDIWSNGETYEFSFVQDRASQCACKTFGWIQIVGVKNDDEEELKRGFYDNGNRTGEPGSGSSGWQVEVLNVGQSIPAAGNGGYNVHTNYDIRRPVNIPLNTNSNNPNPFYGGGGNLLPFGSTDNKIKAFGINPKPQFWIQDTPGGGGSFVTQLVCVDTGKILFSYSWSSK